VKRYRVGSSWDVTIIETDNDLPDGVVMKHENDRLIATAQTPQDASRIVRALNRAARQGQL
jgi:hypothetical protein